MNEKISIIVPIYKVEPYIRECIESICDQTYKNLEILLVDDGSPDECGRICDEYAARDNRIKVFHIQNSGQSHARNVGLEAATGSYIGFVDGDDKANPEMYEKLLNLASEQDSEIVECNFKGRKEKTPDEIPEGTVISMTGREALIRQLDERTASRYPSTSVWSKLFKREVIGNMHFPDGRIHEEYAFLSGALLNAQNYTYLNECLYERTLRSDSTTAEQFSARTLDKIYVYQMRNELLSGRGEKDLLALSKEQEFSLLLYDALQAYNAGMISERQEIEKMIAPQKREILQSHLTVKKKLQYIVFFINKKLYYCLRKDKQHVEKKI